MQMGRRNIIFGWLWLLMGLLLGAYLQFKVGSSPEWMTSGRRMFWRTFHTHASMLAIMNIVYGYCLERVNLGSGLKITGGLLAIMGTMLFSGALLLAGIKYELAKLAFPGSWCIIIAIIILILGLTKRVKET